MINTQRVEAMLRGRYPDLENVGHGVFRGVDRFGSRDYAVRYFDLNDRLGIAASSLKSYQEDVLSQMYFSSQVATDLRWNHYLYFITSDEESKRSEFGRLKARIEADREYARKVVVREDDVPKLFTKEEPTNSDIAMPVDLASTWAQLLERDGLGYVLDGDITVPEAVRRITAGEKQKATRPVTPMALLAAEREAARQFLTRLTINGFRPHPEQKDHLLGRVNLIVGTNGVGKTSLLEAIEFAYCGRNRRSSAVLADTSITLALAGTTEKLSSTTDSARLRARHSNWYAKTELRTVSIQDSFGKFNFLDTDAAVNLSVSASSDQIGADVTRLVLGAAAENLGDRLRRVFEQLQTELKNLRRDHIAQEQAKRAAQDRVDSIKSAPKLSDSLFSELLSSLVSLGWNQPPEEKARTAALRESLREAVTAIELLRRSPIDMLRSDPESALQFLTDLNEESRKASALDEQAKAIKVAQSKAHRDTQAATEGSAAVDALIPYARTDFAKLITDVEERRDDVRARGVRLALVPIDSIQTSAVEAVLSQRVTEAISTVDKLVDDYQRKIATTSGSLQALEKTQNNLTVLKQRLVATAQELLQRSPNPDHCPLCRTEFESGQLLKRITKDPDGDISELAAPLQSELSSAREQLESSRIALATLQSLKTFMAERASVATVMEAFQEIEQDRAKFEIERGRLEAVLSQLQQLRADGLSAEGLSKSLLSAGISALPPLDALRATQMQHKQMLEKAQSDIEKATQEFKTVQQACEAIALRLVIDPVKSTDELVRTVRKLVLEMEGALNAYQTFTGLLKIRSEKTVDEVSVELFSAQRLTADVATAIAQESANNTALEKEEKLLSDIVARINGYNKKITNLESAENVLQTLTKESSGVELTNKILAENAQEIARTFASIHMPNEFELRAEHGALKIVRRQTGAEVQLDQMSTGQRGAFALSLFLAMNGRLRSGPPVLLFDDPVAHVDDINVLSFLDHLRHLAIGGKRQIFFATADTKLAGLFRHKFRFLGEEFKELALSRG